MGGYLLVPLSSEEVFRFLRGILDEIHSGLDSGTSAFMQHADAILMHCGLEIVLCDNYLFYSVDRNANPSDVWCYGSALHKRRTRKIIFQAIFVKLNRS